MVLRLGDGEAWKLGGSADLRFGCLEPRRLGGLAGLKLLKLLSLLGGVWCSWNALVASRELLGRSWELLGSSWECRGSISSALLGLLGRFGWSQGWFWWAKRAPGVVWVVPGTVLVGQRAPKSERFQWGYWAMGKQLRAKTKSLSVLGPSWGALGASLGALVTLWGDLGDLWVCLGSFWMLLATYKSWKETS